MNAVSSFHPVRTGLALSGLLLLAGLKGHGGQVPTRFEAISTQPPPGTPNGYTWSDFKSAAIVDDGEITFSASLRDADTFTQGVGLWRGSSSQYTLVVRRGDNAPNAGGTFNTFGFPAHRGPAATKPLVFFATVDTNPTILNSIWSVMNNVFTKVALVDNSEPGGTTYQNLYVDIQFASKTDVLAFGGASGVADPFFKESLWYVNASTVQLAARTGDPAPGFGQYVIPSPLTSSTHALSGDGVLVFYSQISNSPVVNGINQNQAIFKGKGGIYQPVVRNGENVSTIPGAFFGDLFLTGFTFDVNAAGNVVFTSVLGNQPGQNVITPSNDRALFIDKTKIVQVGDPVPNSVTGETFNQITTALINRDNNVAFEALTFNGFTSRSSIFVFGNEFRRVVSTDDPAPGTEADTLFGDISLPDQLQFNNKGQVAFTASLTGPSIISGTNDFGLWGTDPDGNLLLVARTGDQIEVAPGEMRTIVSFEFLSGPAGPDDGRTKALNDAGQIVFCVRLSGSRSGIVRASLGSASGGSNTQTNLIEATDAADPISTFTGELFGFEKIDLNLGGPMPLVFARYYGSMIASDGNITSALGRNRLHNFDAQLILPDSTSATVVVSNGRVAHFTKDDNKWTLGGRTDIAFQLVQDGADFIFADPRSQRMWTFDESGKLTKIEDGRGNVHTLHYDDEAIPTRLTSVTDNFNRTLAFTYDVSGHLSRARDLAADAPNPAVREVNFTYTDDNLVTATDALGHATTYSYDANGRLLSTQLPRGNAPDSQTYTNNRVVTQTEHPAMGVMQTTSLAYDTSARKTTITDPVASRVQSYTATGELTELEDEAGKSITFTSDATGRRSTVTDQLGRTVTIAYHPPSGKPATVTAEDGATTSFTYKARIVAGITFHDLVKITYPDGTSRSYTYDAKGNLLSAVDQLGKVTRYSDYDHGRPGTVTNPEGGFVKYTYDSTTGNLKTSKDSDTGKTTYTFDEFSRLKHITSPAVPPLSAAEFGISYDDADRITSIIDERGNQFGYTYDNNDNVTLATDPTTATTQLGYDDLDRVIRVTNRLGKMRSLAFDSRNLLASTTDELGHVATNAHDPRQRLSSVTLSGGIAATFDYDDAGRLMSVTDPLIHTGALARNARGSVIASSDALGNSTQYLRDSSQRIVKLIDPLGRQTAFTYDKRSQLVAAARDAVGAGKYTRDAAGRLVKLVDPNGGVWTYTHSPAGRLLSSKDPLGRTTGLAYDARGQVQSIQLADGGTCAIERDKAGDITRVNYMGGSGGDGPDLSFGYDALRRLNSANGLVLTRDAEGRITNSRQSGFDFGATYDDADRLISVTHASGYTVFYQYDNHDRLIALNDNNGAPSNHVMDFGYDLAGQLTSITRPGGLNANFTYDNAGRLTRIQDVVDIKYTLNADGDITATDLTAETLPAVQAGAVQQFKFDKASQLVGTDFAYDARGRLVKSPGHTYTWDAASRLIGLDSATLGYNGLGDITTRSEGGTATEFFHNYALGLAPIVAERNGGQFTRDYVWTPGGRLLFSHGPEGYVFYHCDRLGSTLVLTNATTNTQTDTYAYGPYGEATHNGSSTQPFTFVGAFGVRAEGPLYHMRARYYDPVTARFLSRDPSGPRLSDPRTLDPYIYALGNPARYIDPDGAKERDATYGGTYVGITLDPLTAAFLADVFTGGTILHNQPSEFDIIRKGHYEKEKAAAIREAKALFSTIAASTNAEFPSEDFGVNAVPLALPTAEAFAPTQGEGGESLQQGTTADSSEGEFLIRSEAYLGQALEETGLELPEPFPPLEIPAMQNLADELALAGPVSLGPLQAFNEFKEAAFIRIFGNLKAAKKAIKAQKKKEKEQKKMLQKGKDDLKNKFGANPYTTDPEDQLQPGGK